MKQKSEEDQDYIKKSLMDLLCIIHRDGGHYIDEHGLEKAVEDAKTIWYNKVIPEN